jgi:hypothetical protein
MGALHHGSSLALSGKEGSSVAFLVSFNSSINLITSKASYYRTADS